MSSDLLKEFASPDERPWTPSGPADTATYFEDDDFGDFEGPETKETTIPGNLADVAIRSNKKDDWGDFEEQSVFFDAGTSSKPVLEVRRSGISQNEHVAPVQVPQKGCNKSKPVSQTSVLPINASSSTVAVDESDFEDWLETSQDLIIPTKVATSNALVEPRPSHVTATSTDPGPPPTNVPPPSVLLPLVATLFRSLATDVRMVVSSASVCSDHPKGLDQARVYQIKDALATARAGARIIAGRKLRWKRDTLLSQSMKIGPAIGKSGGMKLAGLDKTESRREDTEAAEAVRAWKQQVGGLRSAVTTANLQMVVPDISDTMPIRVVKASEGAVTAPKTCFLCGVKRDERVAKVDVNVEDSFGEWWTEHWGHVDCFMFWADHKGSLSQR